MHTVMRNNWLPGGPERDHRWAKQSVSSLTRTYSRVQPAELDGGVVRNIKNEQCSRRRATAAGEIKVIPCCLVAQGA